MVTEKTGGVKTSPLRQPMIDQMRIANLAASTQTSYLFEVERMAKHYGASPADLGAEQVRDFVLALLDSGLSPATTNRKCLHIPSGKGGTERMAPLPDGVVHYLRSYFKNIWPQPASWLFYGASPDEPMSAAALNRAFKKARERVGIAPATASTACVIQPRPISLSAAATSR